MPAASSIRFMSIPFWGGLLRGLALVDPVQGYVRDREQQGGHDTGNSVGHRLAEAEKRPAHQRLKRGDSNRCAASSERGNLVHDSSAADSASPDSSSCEKSAPSVNSARSALRRRSSPATCLPPAISHFSNSAIAPCTSLSLNLASSVEVLNAVMPTLNVKSTSASNSSCVMPGFTYRLTALAASFTSS